jgi:hypothetical protein
MIIIIYSTAITALVIFLVFYVRYLLQKLFFFAENIDILRDEVSEYSAHLNTLFEMSVYHGDETIEGLIGHTNHVLEKIEDFEDFYSLLSDPESEPEEEMSDQEENTTQKEV